MDSSSVVARAAKGEEGHCDRAKMGAELHWNFGNALVAPPPGGRGLAVVMEGGRRSPRFCRTGDQTTRCIPFAKSAQALTEQQGYQKSAHVHTPNTCWGGFSHNSLT